MNPPASVKRKLAAILAADVAGYSRLMGEDEEGTLRTLAAHRAVVDGIIQFHDGRIVGTAGDSVLAEFASPVEAVRCAVEVQDALKTRNESLPAEKRMLFRIGVNLGDVMVKGDDLLGDGVNVAARLESIAEPGGICVSGSIYDQIAGKLSMGFVDIGDQTLKNISRPVRVFRVASGAGAIPAAAGAARRAPSRGGVIAAGMIVVALIGGAAAFLTLERPAVPPPAPAEPAKPVAAELPPPDREAMFWESVRNSSERRDLEAYLAEYPSGAFSALARARIEGIAAAETRRAEEDRRAAELQAAAEAQAAAARAKADAAAEASRQQAEAERTAAAKLRQEVEAAAAKLRADAAAASALRAKAEAEAAASARQRAEAERLAKAEAEKHRQAAEETQRQAALEAQRQSTAQASRRPPAASSFDGVWTGNYCATQFREFEAFCSRRTIAVQDGKISGGWGVQGQPGSMTLEGRVDAAGNVTIQGAGVAAQGSARGQPVSLVLHGKLAGDSIETAGKINNRRDITFNLQRASR